MMNRAIWTLGAGALLLAATGMASAFEPPIGSRLGNRLTPSANSNTDETRTAFRFAECQANMHGDQVRAVLDAPNEDRAERARKALEHEESCYLDVYVDLQAEKVRVSMSNASYRGMLAEGILKKDKRAATLAPLPLQPVYERPWTTLTGRPPSVDEMAICVADVDPAGIMTVLATVPQSQEERGAFSGLSEAMGKCLQNGVELSADALALRTAFAEALYHRAYAPQATAAEASGAKGIAE